MRRAVLMIALLVAVAGAPACGGSDEPQTDTQRVREVVEQFNDAFSSGDYDKACDLMHSRRRQQLEYGRGQSCADILAERGRYDRAARQGAGARAHHRSVVQRETTRS